MNIRGFRRIQEQVGMTQYAVNDNYRVWILSDASTHFLHTVLLMLLNLNWWNFCPPINTYKLKIRNLTWSCSSFFLALCWTVNHHPSFTLHALWSSFSLRISLYFTAFIPPGTVSVHGSFHLFEIKSTVQSVQDLIGLNNIWRDCKSELRFSMYSL